MASLERRLQTLEEIYARSRVRPPGSGPSSRQFVSGVLAAIASVRRASLDRPPHGYQIEKLRARETWALAQYVAALSVLRHPDEDQAREILAEKMGDDTVLWSLIDAVVDCLTSSQGREVSF